MRTLALLAAALVLPATPLDAEMLANPAADLAAAMPVCAASLGSGENPPLADGWKPAVHMSGSPLAANALKKRYDLQAMLEGLQHSRETFVLAERGAEPAPNLFSILIIKD